MRTPSTFVISITPFDKKLNLDEDALRGHLQRMAAAGIGVYVSGGGSGEAYTLSQAERRRVVEIAAEELKGKSPVRAMGVEPRTAAEMIDFIRMADDCGMDAVQLYSLDMGHGGAPSRAEMEAYYTDVLSAVDVPVIVSTHYSVGYFIPVELIAGLTERFDNVIGVNITSPDVTYLVSLVEALDPRVEVHVGGPMMALTALAIGASGYLSSEANTAPRLCVSLIEKYKAGDVAGAHDDFRRLIRYFTIIVGHGGVSATKAALGILGLPGGYPRPPRLPLTDPADLDRLSRTLDELGIPALELP
jgi:4-hydroxy-tetrahydrodipicolinate synthase